MGLLRTLPAASIDNENIEGRLVTSQGKVRVLLSSENGEVLAGDFVTSSSTPGQAMRATDNGYVLGVSLIDQEVGIDGQLSTVVALNIHFEAGLSNTRSNLLQVLRGGFSIPLFEPLASLRYLIAALLVLISFSLGFVFFGRMARTGVEAIGRNPLASRMIQANVLVNIIVTIVIVLTGLFAAYLILIL